MDYPVDPSTDELAWFVIAICLLLLGGPAYLWWQWQRQRRRRAKETPLAAQPTSLDPARGRMTLELGPLVLLVPLLVSAIYKLSQLQADAQAVDVWFVPLRPFYDSHGYWPTLLVAFLIEVVAVGAVLAVLALILILLWKWQNPSSRPPAGPKA